MTIQLLSQSMFHRMAVAPKTDRRYIEAGDAEFSNLWEINELDGEVYYRRFIGEACVAVLVWLEPHTYDERYRWYLEIYTVRDHRKIYTTTVLDDAVGNRLNMALNLAHRSIHDWMTGDVLDSYIQMNA